MTRKPMSSYVEGIIPADERSPGAKDARAAGDVGLRLGESDDTVTLQWLGGLADRFWRCADERGISSTNE